MSYPRRDSFRPPFASDPRRPRTPPWPPAPAPPRFASRPTAAPPHRAPPRRLPGPAPPLPALTPAPRRNGKDALAALWTHPPSPRNGTGRGAERCRNSRVNGADPTSGREERTEGTKTSALDVTHGLLKLARGGAQRGRKGPGAALDPDASPEPWARPESRGRAAALQEPRSLGRALWTHGRADLRSLRTRPRRARQEPRPGDVGPGEARSGG